MKPHIWDHRTGVFTLNGGQDYNGRTDCNKLCLLCGPKTGRFSNRHGFLGNCPKDMRKVMIAQMEWVFSNRQPLFFVLWVIGVSSGLMLGGSCSWFDGKGVSSILMPAPQLNQLHLPPTKLLSETLYFETTSIDPDSLVPWFLKPLAITGLAHMSRTGCHSQSSTRTPIYKFFLDKMTLVYGRYICM